MLIGTQQAASQRFVCPVTRTSVARMHLRHQFLLCSFCGIQRVRADCLPEVSFSEDTTAPTAHTYGTAQACLCFRVSLVGHCALCLSIWHCTFPLELHFPPGKDSLEAPDEVWRSFPCSVVQIPPLLSAIICTCKHQALLADLLLGMLCLYRWSRFKNSIYKFFFYIWAIEDNMLGLGRMGLFQ